MEQTTEKQSVLRDLAFIYIALAHGADQRLDDNEIDAIAQRLRGWQFEVPSGTVVGAVKQAVDGYVHGDVEQAFEEAVRRVGEAVPKDQRQHIMDDLVEIAMADDKFLFEEGSFIEAVARAWDVHASDLPEEDRRKWSILSQETRVGEWSAVHDLAVVYLTLAHQTDSDLSTEEVGAITEKLNEWLPDAKEVDVLNIVQEVITAYADGGDQRLFVDAVESVRKAVPEHQRAVLLSDLRFVAEADGRVIEAEEKLIERLARAWSRPATT